MENDTKTKEEDAGNDKTKRYYVDFYDMFDGWGGFGFFADRLFCDLDEAIKLCNKLNSELAKGNKDCGEHYGVIDSKISREVYCGQDDTYKTKMSDLGEHLFGTVMLELGELGISVGRVKKEEKINRMKVPGTDFDVRVNEPPEQIEMYAHSADCRYCNGTVKMFRDPKTMKLQPNNCSCLMCGQRYFVVIEDTVEAFELQQWRQKGQTFAMGGDICPGRIKNGEK